VIELKLSKGRNKAVGQLLYYMGWIDANLGHGPCRGMIVAREIPTDLVLAVQRASGISLLRYKVNLSIEQVPIATSST
jgi:endonuclease